MRGVPVGSAYVNRSVGLTYPTLAIDRSGGPHDGRLYAAAQSNGTDYDILVSWSDDDGGSWSVPVRLNDDAVDNGADQFHQWIDVDADGVVHGIYFDRRNDPENLRIQAAWTAFDPDSGTRHTEMLGEAWWPSPPEGSRPNYGDYITVAAGRGEAAGTLALAWDQYSGRGENDMDVHAAVLRLPR